MSARVSWRVELGGVLSFGTQKSFATPMQGVPCKGYEGVVEILQND